MLSLVLVFVGKAMALDSCIAQAVFLKEEAFFRHVSLLRSTSQKVSYPCRTSIFEGNSSNAVHQNLPGMVFSFQFKSFILLEAGRKLF
jgi:hypothetical protein